MLSLPPSLSLSFAPAPLPASNSVARQVVARAEELLEKVQGSEKLKAIAGSDTGAPSVASILAKNPQVRARSSPVSA